MVEEENNPGGLKQSQSGDNILKSVRSSFHLNNSMIGSSQYGDDDYQKEESVQKRMNDGEDNTSNFPDDETVNMSSIFSQKPRKKKKKKKLKRAKSPGSPALSSLTFYVSEKKQTTDYKLETKSTV